MSSCQRTIVLGPVRQTTRGLHAALVGLCVVALHRHSPGYGCFMRLAETGEHPRSPSLCFIVQGLIVLMTVGLSLPAIAQVSVEQQRNSLRGIQRFYVSVNVEGPRALAEREELDVRKLTSDVEVRLQRAQLPVVGFDAEAASERPYLHVHINTMDAGRGLVPFSVEARFFQPVQLVRDPSRRTVASTWEHGLVGIVSYDQIQGIPEGVMQAVDGFVEAFRRANP